jgi:hypothetical protein
MSREFLGRVSRTWKPQEHHKVAWDRNGPTNPLNFGDALAPHRPGTRRFRLDDGPLLWAHGPTESEYYYFYASRVTGREAMRRLGVLVEQFEPVQRSVLKDLRLDLWRFGRKQARAYDVFMELFVGACNLPLWRRRGESDRERGTA